MASYKQIGDKNMQVHDTMQQRTDELIWKMIDNFYISYLLFDLEYESYHAKIEMLCKKDQKKDLSSFLSIEEAITLLSYDKLNEIKEKHIQFLRKYSHQYTKGEFDKGLFNYYVKDIYHELSILLDEVYKLKVSAPDYIMLEDEEECQAILKEVYVLFPTKIYHLKKLFQSAKKELEGIIRNNKFSNILMRSFCLFGEEYISPTYNGFDKFAEMIYQNDIFELYAKTAVSFHKSGFYDHAKDSARKARKLLRQEKYKHLIEPWYTTLSKIIDCKTSSHKENKIS